MEVWKDVEGTEGKYQISNYGRVLSKRYRNSHKEKILTPHIAKIGYHEIKMKINGKRQSYHIHRLVANHFVGNKEQFGKREVNHIDGDKLNNHWSNLEWVTSSRNTDHAVEIGLFKPWGKDRKPIIAIDIKTHNQTHFKSVSEAEIVLGTRHICAVLHGKRCSTKGYTFMYDKGGDSNGTSVDKKTKAIH